MTVRDLILELEKFDHDDLVFVGNAGAKARVGAVDLSVADLGLTKERVVLLRCATVVIPEGECDRKHFDRDDDECDRCEELQDKLDAIERALDRA